MAPLSRVSSKKRVLDSWDIRTSLIRLCIAVDTLYSDYHENYGSAHMCGCCTTWGSFEEHPQNNSKLSGIRKA